MESYFFTPPSQNGVDTSITLDAAKWNCDGAELSSCVITLFYWIMYYNIRNTFGTNLPVDLSFCFMYLYPFRYEKPLTAARVFSPWDEKPLYPGQF